jgi:soluble lytic murein transglycosylase-like protein
MSAMRALQGNAQDRAAAPLAWAALALLVPAGSPDAREQMMDAQPPGLAAGIRPFMGEPDAWSLPDGSAHGHGAVGRWSGEIDRAAARFGLPARWIAAVMRAESGGQVQLDGRPITSVAGAMGLMQLMPGTWADMRAMLGLGHDPHAPRDNILAGSAYLALLHRRFGYPGLFGAYHAGPGRYGQYLAHGRPLPRETRSYMAKILEGLAREGAAGPWSAAQGAGHRGERGETIRTPSIQSATAPESALFVVRPPLLPPSSGPQGKAGMGDPDGPKAPDPLFVRRAQPMP